MQAFVLLLWSCLKTNIYSYIFTATEKLWLKWPIPLSCLVLDRQTGEQLGQTHRWRRQTFSLTPAKVHIISQSKNILKLMRRCNSWVALHPAKHNSQTRSRLCASIQRDLQCDTSMIKSAIPYKTPASLKKVLVRMRQRSIDATWQAARWEYTQTGRRGGEKCVCLQT